MGLMLYDYDGQLSILEPVTDEEVKKAPHRTKRRANIMGLIAIPYQYCDLTPGHGDLLGDAHWEFRSPILEDGSILNTGLAPREPVCSSLASVLEDHPDKKYYLSRTACLGILRRAEERGKELPAQLNAALVAQAGLAPIHIVEGGLKAYHINQRDEGIDLDGLAGALMATANMQMQTFVTGEPVRFFGYSGIQDGDKPATLNEDCSMPTHCADIVSPIAFAANQRDEVRDLHDVAGAICACQTMKQQTFIAERCLTPWETQQKRIILPDGVAPTLAGADGGGGRSPGGLLFSAAFSAGAGSKAGSIGYSEQVAPTLKGAPSGNCMPSVLCLNDQGGAMMELSEDVTGTLRAQEHGHQPLVFANHGQDARFVGPIKTAQTVTAAFGMGGDNTPLIVREQKEEKPPSLVFENHGIDSRYTGPHMTAPTISARAGTGGNNLPLVAEGSTEEEIPVICITGNAIDRQPKNGGNGLGIDEGVAFTLTSTDRHAIFSRQRVDSFKPADVVGTESARQHKDATDLVYQETADSLSCSGHKEPNSCVAQNMLEEGPLLIRRLTPLECERLQGFPDGWTALPGAADSARYKALGNSVAIPCVEFVLSGIMRVFALFL